MLVAKWRPLPTETSRLSSEIVIRRQKGGQKCNPDTPLRQRLTLYGVSVLVPNILEDKLIRSLVQNGKSLAWAYWAVRVSDLIPPFPLSYCAEKVFKSGGPGPQTCDGFLNCLQWYLEETGRLVVPEAGPLPAEPVEMEIIPGTGPPQEWLEWIEAVARLVPQIPPPQTPTVRADGLPGPPEEWLEWISTVAPLVPQIPPPEAISEAELPPGPEPSLPEIPVITAPAIRPGPPPEPTPAERMPGEELPPGPVADRTGLRLVGLVAGLLAAIFLLRSARGGS